MIAEERQELMRIARELQAALQVHNKMVNLTINKLLSEADAMKLSALAEGPAEVVATKKLAYNPPVEGKVRKTLKVPISAATALAEVDKKLPKKRGPVSPERKAKLVEALKKARAARAQKRTDGN